VQSLTAAVVGQALLFLSGPILARVLGVEGRGQLALFLLSIALVAQIGLVGLPVAVTHHLAGHKNPRPAAADLWLSKWRWMATCVPAALIASLIAYVLMRSDRLPDSPLSLLFVGVITFAIMVQTMLLAGLAGLGEFRLFNCLRVLPAVSVALVAVLATMLDLPALSVLLAMYGTAFLIATLITGAVVGRLIPAGGTPKAVPKKRLYRFGVLALVGASNPADALSFDQAAVGLILGDRALGLYVVAVAFANFSNLLLSSIGLIGSPRVAAARDDAAKAYLVRRYLQVGLVVGGVQTILALAVLPWLIPVLYGEDFESSVGVARVLAVAGLLVGIRRLLTLLAQGCGRPKLASVSETCALVILLLALPLLISVMGLYGAAGAVALASAVGAGITAAGLLRPRSRRQGGGEGLPAGRRQAEPRSVGPTNFPELS
jgi:O-antigen/teichoic acid export membrane protein